VIRFICFGNIELDSLVGQVYY